MDSEREGEGGKIWENGIETWCQDPKVNLRWGGLLSKDLLSGDLLQAALADNTLLWGIAAVLEARPLLAGGQEMAL